MSESGVKFRVGVHEVGGPTNALSAAINRGATALQFFSKQKLAYWFGSEFRRENHIFAQHLQEHDRQLVVHGGYCLNLLSQDWSIRKLSLASLVAELDAAKFLGAKVLNIHPGSVGGGNDLQVGTPVLIEALKSVLLDAEWGVELTLEVMPGGKEWSQAGSLLDQLAEVVNALKSKGANIGVCFDTCHAFAAGYEFTASRKDYDFFWGAWYDFFGAWPSVLHINGAANPQGSRKDGHASLNGKFSANMTPIPKPHINPEVFKWIRQDARFANSIHILETPQTVHERDLPAYIAGAPDWRHE